MTDHNHHEPHGHEHGHDHDRGTVSEPIPLRLPGAALDWERVREKLADKTGPRYWRSLDELADSPEFQAMIHREFPTNASE